MKMKEYYDAHHQPRFFQVGDLVKLRLHKGYKMPAVSSKFGPQFVGPFIIRERIGRLAYRLDLPPNMKIHDVVSVAQLEPTTDPASGQHGRRPPPPGPTAVDNEDEWEVERLLRKRSRHIGRAKAKRIEYLVRWVGYGPEHDAWMSLKDLGHCQDLIDEFEACQKEAVIKSIPNAIPIGSQKIIAVRPPGPLPQQKLIGPPPEANVLPPVASGS